MTKVTTTQRRSSAIIEYLQDMRTEMRKVVWPTREEAINLTVVVLVVLVAMTLILGGMDLILGRLLNFVITLGPTA